LAKGSLRAAEKSALEAVRLAPNDAFNHCHLADVYARRRKWHAALEETDRALALNPTYADCMQTRAFVLGRLKRTDEAIEAAEAALALDPQASFGHTVRGCLHLERCELDKAKESFREALRLDPTDDAARSCYDLSLSRERTARRLVASSESHGGSGFKWWWLVFLIGGQTVMRACSEMSQIQ